MIVLVFQTAVGQRLVRGYQGGLVTHRTPKFVVVVAAVLFSLCIGAAAQFGPTPFSADMASKDKQGQKMVGKFYFAGEKLRIDMNHDGQNVSMIHNIPEKISYILMPQQKMYMEMHTNQQGMQRRGPDVRNLRSFDPAHPCASFTDTTCEKVGSDTVDGRSTEKWIFTNKNNGEKATAWVDNKLHFPIKVLNQDGSEMEFTNIQEGTPSASLFEIPSGYRKFDMSGMMGGHMPQQ